MLYLAADHNGFMLKHEIKEYLDRTKIKYQDLGNLIFDPNDDYPDFAILLAMKVKMNKKNTGILICGSSQGMAMTANKIKGIRAVSVWDKKSACLAREHLDANVMSMGGKFIGSSQAKEIIRIWIKTNPLKAKRYLKRIKKIQKLEK